jgi:hypothetical protein
MPEVSHFVCITIALLSYVVIKYLLTPSKLTNKQTGPSDSCGVQPQGVHIPPVMKFFSKTTYRLIRKINTAIQFLCHFHPEIPVGTLGVEIMLCRNDTIQFKLLVEKIVPPRTSDAAAAEPV